MKEVSDTLALASQEPVITLSEGNMFRYEMARRVGRIQWFEYAQPIYEKARSLGKSGDDARVILGTLSEQARSQLLSFFSVEPSAFSLKDTMDWHCRLTSSRDDVESKISSQTSFYKHHPASEKVKGAFQTVLSEVYPTLHEVTGCHWQVINTSAVLSKSGADYGMYDWHKDGFPNALRKLLIFPNSLNEANGTFEYEDPADNGNRRRLQTESASWVFCDVNRVMHRGRPGTEMDRPCLQVTLACAEQADTEFKELGLNAHYPLSPLSLK